MATASGIKQQDRQNTITGWIFMSPTLVIMAIFLLIPIIFAVVVSFTDWNGISPPLEANWVGFENYQRVLFQSGITQSDFYTSLKNTTYFAMGVVPLQTIIALVLAVIINQAHLKFKQFFRVSYYFPSVTSSIAISLLFMLMYQRDGTINSVLNTITFGLWPPVIWLNDARGFFHIILSWIGVTAQTVPPWFIDTTVGGVNIWSWISGPSVSLIAIMLMNTWTTIGTMMLIFVAALQDVPIQVYEAASLDGATAWQTFRKITLPLLRPTTFFVVTLGLIGTFQVFDQIYVMSSGGPAKTTLTIAYLVYREGFRNSAMGVGATIAIILFFLIFVITMLQRRITEGKAEEK
jgi:multiple sugar transport system permease protein